MDLLRSSFGVGSEFLRWKEGGESIKIFWHSTGVYWGIVIFAMVVNIYDLGTKVVKISDISNYYLRFTHITDSFLFGFDIMTVLLQEDGCAAGGECGGCAYGEEDNNQ